LNHFWHIGKSSEPRTEPKMRQQCGVKPCTRQYFRGMGMWEVGVSASYTDKLLPTK